MVSKTDVTLYNKTHYGDVISAARRKAELTQQQLAQALGINKNIVTHWEAGRVKPDLNLIPQLCRALRISFEDFFQLPVAQSSLSLREQKLLDTYRSLSGRDKLIFESALQKTSELNRSELWTRCKDGFIRIFHNHQTVAAGTAGDLDKSSGKPVFVRKNRLSLRCL